MKILITGGAGYIGNALISALVQLPEIEHITVYDNLSRNNYNFFIANSKFSGSSVSFIKGDLLDTRKLGKAIDEADIVVHLAAKVSTPFADQNPHEFDQVNNWGTAGLTYLIENSTIKKFIFLSSISVYGASDEISGATTIPNPGTFYGISKLRAEDHIQRLVGGKTEILILRCANVYGYNPCMRFDSVINKFLFEAHFSNRIKILGDGNQYRTFIHIERLTNYLRNLITENYTSGIYNLTESIYSVNEIAAVLQQMYPDLESVFVNQNMKMRNLKVESDARICLPEQHPLPSLLEDLTNFKKSFSF